MARTKITTTKEAKKYYPLFGLGANVALIFSGQYVRFVSAFRASLPAHVDKWGVSLKLLMGETETETEVMGKTEISWVRERLRETRGRQG